MFANQITSLTSQIQELTAKRERIQLIGSQLEDAIASITKIKESAPELGIEEEVSQELAAAFGISNNEELKKQVLAQQQELTQQQKYVTELEEVITDFKGNNAALQEQLAASEGKDGHEAEKEEPAPVAVAFENEQLDILDAIESVKRYESAVEIAEALAETEEIDTHLMAIASILDTCPQDQVAGRTWFFVQNIPTDYDDRLFGYLPLNVRSEWLKQRAAVQAEVETVPETVTEIAPELKAGDLVEIYTGEKCSVLQAERVGTSTYAEVKTPEGRTETYRDTDLKLINEEEARDSIFPKSQPHYFQVNDLVECPTGKVGHISEIRFDTKLGRVASVVVPDGTQQHSTIDLKYIGKYQPPVEQVTQIAVPVAAKAKTKTKKTSKSSATDALNILKCKNWASMRAIANNDPKLIKDAALSAKTKAEKELIESLPEIIRDFMYETRDFSDLDWLPAYVVQSVRKLFSEPGTAA